MKAKSGHCVFRTLWVFISASVLHVWADCSFAQREILNESVMQKWKDYEAFSHGLQGTVRLHRIRVEKGKEKVIENTSRYKQNRECALYISSWNPSKWQYSLGNSNYQAGIDVSKTDRSDAPLLRYYMPKPLSVENEDRDVNSIVFQDLSCHFECGGRSLRRAVSDRYFTLTKVVKEIQNREESIQVDYKYNYEIGNIHYREQGSLWLDPSRCWCIRKKKYSHEERRPKVYSEKQVEMTFETIEHPSGFPILKSVTKHTIGFTPQFQRGKVDMVEKYDYDLEVNASIPDSEFTLSAFGLPEPGSEPVKKPIPMYVWILVIAGVCAALALSFRYLARRARPKPFV